MELFAIVKNDKTLWAAVTTEADAQETAVRLSAGGHGMVRLVSGEHLAEYLVEKYGVPKTD